MASWNIGINDVSEETQAFRNRLSSKDSQIAAQETQLMKQAAELEEFKLNLNETLHKLSREAERALRLERDLTQCSEDLRNEKINSQNVQSALSGTQEKIKAKDLESRELQANIEKLSYRSDETSTYNTKLEREKGVLEARVRELEVNFQQLSCPPSTPGRLRVHRPRSSSLSDFRITTLEQELRDARASLAHKETELRSASEKLARMQTEAMQVDNRMIAVERKLKMQLSVLGSSLEEKEEELAYMKDQQGDGSREEELLKRVEEDEAKIAALEMLLKDNRELQSIKESLKQAEHKLRSEMEGAEAREIELVKEKEEALDELEDARTHIDKLTDLLRKREDEVCDMKGRQVDLQARLASAEAVPANVQDGNVQLAQKSNDDVTSMFDTGTAYPRQSTPVPQALPDEEAVTYIERLLAAIDRLRGERDGLRRDVQFLETESKFAVEALEAKLAQTITTDGRSVALKDEVDNLRIQLDRAMTREEDFAGRAEGQVRRFGLATAAFAVVVGHLQFQTDAVTHHIDRKQAQLDEKDQKLAETNERLADLVIKLEVTSRSLADAISHQNDLHSQVTQLSSKNEEWIAETELLKNACQGSKDILERTEARLVDVAASLEEVEAERDSLILQLTNLQTDFNCAQQEVAEAESRYSHLQFHQLSSMSSNDVIQSLREQIRELEMRVLRRTEQIGIHQHDIKRLETNMRLQEERVGEMTVELEMLSEQKEAMVEDCADAREARDEAIQRVEALEEQLEALEGKLEILGEQRRNETTGLVGVVFQTIGHSRNAIMAAKARAEVQIRQARQADETRIRARNDTSADEIRQTMLALAVCKLELSRSAVSLQSVYGAGADLQAQVDDLREQLGAKVAKITSLSEQLDTLQAQQLEAETLARDLLASHVRDFEVKSRDLQQTNENMKISHEETVRDLLQTQNDLHGRLAETEHMFTNDDLDNALEQLRTQHAKALANLEARLEYIANELNEARRSSADSERQHQQVLDLSVQSRKELETRLLAASDRLQAVEQLQNELTRMRTEHAKTVTHLQARLDSAIEEALTARNRLDGLQAEHQVTIDELARATQDYDHHLAQAAENLLSVQSQLDDSVQQVRQLDLKLREEGEDKETLKKDLYLTNVRHDQVASVQAELREELTTTKAQLDETRFVLEALQEEKGTLQIETTNLEAEIQRSISLHRFLESQVKDSERTITSLREALEYTRSALSSSEKSGKTAEMSLSLQTAQYERTMSNLNRELAALRSQPNLEETVTQLQARNDEMDELLRSKCAEIEENDDRFIEVLKEKKKLTTKIESLSRKVQNLQNKLAEAKMSTPAPQATVPAQLNPLSTTTASGHPVPPHPPTVAITAPTIPPVPSYSPATSIGRVRPDRIASGPSSLPRPKTPERRAQTAVFKAKTPEKRMTPARTPEAPPSSSAIGKKRRAPDDFEACESVPAQGFTADSLPRDDMEHTTPRLRRDFQSGQGFTPLRHHAARPTIPIPSPKRVLSNAGRPPIYIADVTNSPRLASAPIPSTKEVKRSWLGRIRGAPSQLQVNGRTSSRVFERLPGGVA